MTTYNDGDTADDSGLRERGRTTQRSEFGDSQPTEDPGVSALKRRLKSGRRAVDEKTFKVELDAHDIRQQVALGMVDGLAMIKEDEKFFEDFVEKLFKGLARHTASASSQWVGRRLFTATVLFICAMGLTYLLRNGLPK